MSPAEERDAAVRAALRQQSRACARLGSPFMARLMALLGERLATGGPVADALLGWPGDPGIGADNPGLRLAGGLHGLVLDGSDADLAAAYPPHATGDADLWAAVETALDRHPARLLGALERAPQTNEVRRSAALIPAFALVARVTGRPLALWEIGCAGGLNLRADFFGLKAGHVAFGPPGAAPQLAPDWEGAAPPPAPLAVVERRGVDLAPLDPTDDADRLRLLSYLWPDQPARRALTEAAIARATLAPAEVDADDAIAWLARRLPGRRPHAVTVIFHTVAWQYLPKERRQEGDDLLASAGATAPADAPLARIAMEADGAAEAALSLTLWPGGKTHALARVDFHGRSVRWTGPTTLAPGGPSTDMGPPLS